jgi:predicted HicB family RNase H-like nuclease
MLCVRVLSSLRRRVKLAAVQTGRSIQELAADALEAECRRHDL